MMRISLTTIPLVVAVSCLFFGPRSASAATPCRVSTFPAPSSRQNTAFGVATAISGDVFVVGAYLDANSGSTAGAAYVFRRAGIVWNLEAVLTSSDASDGDFFGYDVAIDGDVIVVGAIEVFTGNGAAYVFRHNGTDWVEEAKLTASDGALGDEFGVSVAISGETIVVGAELTDSRGPSYGSAYIFVRSGRSWTEQAILPPASSSAFGFFGREVTITGDRLVVAAPGMARVFVFRRVGASWVQESVLAPGSAVPYFGEAVAISGDRLLVGAGREGGGLGAVYVFRREGTEWLFEAELQASNRNAVGLFGRTVALSGNQAVVAAISEDAIGNRQFLAYVFHRDDGNTPLDPSDDVWLEDDILTTTDAFGDPNFGGPGSLAIQGNTVVLPSMGLRGIDTGQVAAFAVSGDCNNNGTLDLCEILDGTSRDVDGNGIPDACGCLASASPAIGALGAGNRYLTFRAGQPGTRQAVQVTFVDLPAPFDVWNGVSLWVGPPRAASENGGSIEPVVGFNHLNTATLQCDPFFTEWNSFGTVFVFDEGIIPGASYEIRTVDATCTANVAGNFSSPLSLTTPHWGDVVGPFDLTTGTWSPPDGSVDITVDLVAMLDKFRSLATAPGKAGVDLAPATPDRVIDIIDLNLALSAFRNQPFPFAPGPVPCLP